MCSKTRVLATKKKEDIPTWRRKEGHFMSHSLSFLAIMSHSLSYLVCYYIFLIHVEWCGRMYMLHAAVEINTQLDEYG